MNQVVIYGISANMTSLVHTGDCGTSNTIDTITIKYYVVKFLTESFTLQDRIKIDRQVKKEGWLVFKSKHLSIMKAKKKILEKKLR